MNHLDENVYNLINRIKEDIEMFDGVELITDFPVRFSSYIMIEDAVISKNKELLAVFDFRPYVDYLDLTDVLISRRGDRLQCKYLIVTNGLQIYLYNTYEDIITSIDSTFSLVSSIFSALNEEQIKTIKHEIAQVLADGSRKFFDRKLKVGLDNKRFMQVIEHFSYEHVFDALKYDPNGQFFRLGHDIRLDENFENQLFSILLDDVSAEASVYRYSTLDTVFATINSGNVRMSGIAGMNDPSELDYVDQYLDRNYSVFTDFAELTAINKRFIICCSELKDTLNQWRLYGDDCKGACMVFSLRQGNYLPGVRVKKISYGTKIDGRPFHMELELLKYLIEEVRLITRQSLQFKSLGIWKHFFKPFEYEEEKEVRILMVLNRHDSVKGSEQPMKKEWNLTASHKIIAPFVNIPLDDPILPFQLSSITLGSRCSEKQLNKVQMEVMLAEKALAHVKIKHSEIDNYR